MNRTLVPNGGPKLRLVEAAEKLFAEKGFDVVSVRDITQAAGGNVAAVNYHFGSRDGLVGVVMTRYLAPVNAERLARLEAAEQKWAGQAVPVEEVVDAFVRPLITQVEKSELSELLFYRLVGRIFGSHGQGIPAEIEAQISALIDRFIRVLAKSLPTVAEEDLVWRLHFVVGSMIYMLTHGEAVQRLSQGPVGKPDMEATLGRLLGFAVAGLQNGVVGAPADRAVAVDHLDNGGPGDGREAPPDLAGSNMSSGESMSNGHNGEPHHPPPEATAEALPKPEKRQSKKVVQESPQVMFEF